MFFDKIDDLINFGTAVGEFDSTDPFSVVSWVNVGVLNGVNQFIISRDVGNKGWHLRIGTDNQAILILFSSGSDVRGANTSTFSTGWHLLVGTYDGSGSTSSVKIYIDGVEDTNPVNNGTLGSMTQTTDLFIGHSGRTPSSHFGGLIDETILYFNKVLSLAEIQQLYNPKLKGMGDQTSPANRALDVRMVGPIGSSADGVTIKDRSGKNHDGLGDDGGNDSGLTFEAGPLSPPGGPVRVVTPAVLAGVVNPVFGNYGIHSTMFGGQVIQ